MSSQNFQAATASQIYPSSQTFTTTGNTSYNPNNVYGVFDEYAGMVNITGNVSTPQAFVWFESTGLEIVGAGNPEGTPYPINGPKEERIDPREQTRRKILL